MLTNPQIIPKFAPFGAANVLPTPQDTNALAFWGQTQQTDYPGFSPSAALLPQWAQDGETRHEYMLACLEQDIAWQVRINREQRGWTQTQLASMIGTRQSAIARAEDDSYGRLSVNTLTKIAKAFRCALLLRFVPYDRFAKEVTDTSPEALYVSPLEE